MKTSLKLKVKAPSQDNQDIGPHYDPDRLRIFESTLDEYLARYCAIEVKECEVEELRELLMDLLEQELRSLPRIASFESSVKNSRIFQCILDIHAAIAHQDDSSDEETALFHLIAKILFAFAYAEKLCSTAMSH